MSIKKVPALEQRFATALIETSYIDSLPSQPQTWIKTFLRAETCASRQDFLALTGDDAKSDSLARQAARDRYHERCDAMSILSENLFFEDTSENSISLCKDEETNTSPEEEVMLRELVEPEVLVPQGSGVMVNVGGDVVVRVDGHTLNNCLGKVLSHRRGQMLVETKKGIRTFQVYLDPRDVSAISVGRRLAVA